MKTHSFYLLAVAGGVALFALAAPQPISGQSPLQSNPSVAPTGDAEFSPQVVALVKELTAQSQQLAANQAEMDAKIAAIEEAIRQARIFAARSGGASK